jgi:uncharacterized protein
MGWAFSPPYDIIIKLYYKHNVKEHEVLEVLETSKNFRFVEKGNYKNENVYVALGQTYSGRYLIVFFIYQEDKTALILSARDMDNAERKRYQKR